MDIKNQIFQLIKETSTKLPQDIIDQIRFMRGKEEKDGTADSVLGTILENIDMAKANELPICQDTGFLFFVIHHPVGVSTLKMRRDISEAIIEATQHNYLRPNAVDTVSGTNSGTNIGVGAPSVYFYEWEKEDCEVRLMLKGGGSENVGIQFKLPDTTLNAGRDLDGVRKVVLEGVFKAQGLGCAPGTLGIGIGGDRGSSCYLSKMQLFRKLQDVNPIPELADLEQNILESANQLGIGPMGFGGMTTLLGTKIGAYHRHPATYYVTVSYLCWAGRRKVMTIKKNGEYIID